MKYYLVESQSQFVLRYLVATNNENTNGRIQHLIDQSKLSEFSQNFLGEKIIGVEELSLVQLRERFKDDPMIFGDITDHVNEIDAEQLELLPDEEQL